MLSELVAAFFTSKISVEAKIIAILAIALAAVIAMVIFVS